MSKHYRNIKRHKANHPIVLDLLSCKIPLREFKRSLSDLRNDNFVDAVSGVLRALFSIFISDF